MDYWSGRVHRGPTTLEVDAPLDRIPLFIRAGAIVPMLPEGVETLVRRHEDMADDIVALDDRRVVEVWPGGTDAIRTWDGLVAILEQRDDRMVLELESYAPRSVEVRLRGRRLPGVSVPGGRVRIDDGTDTTVLSIPDLREPVTITWPRGDA